MGMNEDLNAPFVDDDDVDGLDLTPRPAPTSGTAGGGDRTRKLLVGGVVGVLAVVLMVVAWKGLTDASLYFRTADEAVAQRDSLGDKRFRIEGTVVPGSISSAGTSAINFLIESNGVQAEIRHLGDPPDLFQPGIPVVLEGRWSGSEEWFESDRMLVKHSETYSEENPDRTDDYDTDDSAQSWDSLLELHTESIPATDPSDSDG